MKKVLVAMGMSCAMALSSYALEGFYGGAGLAIEDVDDGDVSTALVLNGGKEIRQLGPGVIGAEGELTYTLLPHEYDVAWTTYDIRYLTLGAYATYRYDLDQKFYVKGRAGLNVSTATDAPSYTDDGIGVAVSAQAAYRLNSHIDLNAGLTVMSVGIKQLSFTAQYKF